MHGHAEVEIGNNRHCIAGVGLEAQLGLHYWRQCYHYFSMHKHVFLEFLNGFSCVWSKDDNVMLRGLDEAIIHGFF